MPKVFKFGGALLKSTEGIRRMISLVDEFQHESLVIVVSAIGKTTNALEELYNISSLGNPELLQKKYIQLKQQHIRFADALATENARTLTYALEDDFLQLWGALNISYPDWYQGYDQVISFGEQFSGRIIKHFLIDHKIPLRFIDARSLIVTDNRFTNASVNWVLTQKTIVARVLPAFEKKELVLTQGFLGANEQGVTTTLGREGSDFTAAILAYALQVQEVCIWKDVPGLMSADPRLFPDAVKLPHVSYNEAIELAFYGASVIHPKTIQPLKKMGILLNVCPFFEPQATPTHIDADESDDANTPKIIIKKNQALLSISSRDLTFMAEEALMKVFDALSKNRFHLNLMQNSAVSFSLIFDENQEKLEKLMEDLKDFFILKFNTGLELLTIRHYNNHLISDLSNGKHIFLTQKNRTTIQLLMKSS